MSIPDQIVVKLQYSNKLGDVTQSNLQALLDDLSKVRAFIATSHAHSFAMAIHIAVSITAIAMDALVSYTSGSV